MAKLFALCVILAVAVASVDATRFFTKTTGGGSFFTTKKRIVFKEPKKTVIFKEPKKTFTLKLVKADDDVTTLETTKVTPSVEVESVDVPETVPGVVISAEVPEVVPEVPVAVAVAPEPAPEVAVAVAPEPAPEVAVVVVPEVVVPEPAPEVPVVLPEPRVDVPEEVVVETPEVEVVTPEVEVVTPEVEVVTPEVEVVVPEVEVEVQVVPGAEGECEDGFFFVKKVEFEGCMMCDAQCVGDCLDVQGCRACAPGYFTWREDEFWPWECRKCEDFVPGCTECKQDIDLEVEQPSCAV